MRTDLTPRDVLDALHQQKQKKADAPASRATLETLFPYLPDEALDSIEDPRNKARFPRTLAVPSTRVVGAYHLFDVTKNYKGEPQLTYVRTNRFAYNPAINHVTSAESNPRRERFKTQSNGANFRVDLAPESISGPAVDYAADHWPEQLVHDRWKTYFQMKALSTTADLVPNPANPIQVYFTTDLYRIDIMRNLLEGKKIRQILDEHLGDITLDPWVAAELKGGRQTYGEWMHGCENGMMRPSQPVGGLMREVRVPTVQELSDAVRMIGIPEISYTSMPGFNMRLPFYNGDRVHI
jgi:hypothetical protein